MRISLLNGTTIYPLAGQAGVPESVHSSASGYRIEGEIAKQTGLRVRADHATTWDRKNLKTTLAFDTVRTFATCLLAEKFSADYDETFPRSGVIIIAGTGGTGVPTSILVAGDVTDGGDPVVFPLLEAAGTLNGRPQYLDPLDADTGVYWGGVAWVIKKATMGIMFTSADDVASPDLCTTWAEIGGFTGHPVCIGTYPYSRYLLDAVIDPPGRVVIGCSVMLSYTATGGRLATEIAGTWSSEIPWPVGGNWESM